MNQLFPHARDGVDLAAVYAADRAPTGGRPWVFANMVAGLDGSSSVDGRTAGLSGPTDRALFHLLRSLADGVVVGAGTVRSEHYGPVRLTDEQRSARTDAGRTAVPPLVVVTRSLRLDWTSRLFDQAEPVRPIVVTVAAAGDTALARAAEHGEVIVAGEEVVDLGVALASLAGMGMAAVLTEGGPILLGELNGGGMLDELCLSLAPITGGDTVPILSVPTPGPLVPFRLASVCEADGHLFLRYLANR